MMRFLLALLLLLAVGSGCKKAEKETSTPVNDSLTVQEGATPHWLDSLPQNAGFVYATGQAVSRRPEIARRKAVLNARLELAKKLSVQGDSLNVLLRWSTVKEEKQIKEGGRWKSFVLMEVPLPESKQEE